MSPTDMRHLKLIIILLILLPHSLPHLSKWQLHPSRCSGQKLGSLTVFFSLHTQTASVLLSGP